MENLNKIYKCNICGNVVELIHVGGGELVCCGQPMELLIEKTKDEGMEKHVPVIGDLPPTACEVKDGVIVKVGEVEHPMDKDHYIEWIEIIVEDGKKGGRKYLKSGDKPEVEFYSRKKVLGARIYCNVHGLWKSS